MTQKINRALGLRNNDRNRSLDYTQSDPISNPSLDILEYDFTIQKGIDLTVPLYLLDGANKPMNLNGYTAKCNIAKDYGTPPMDVLTTENRRIVVDGKSSTIYLEFPKSVTDKYKMESLNKSYIEDLGNRYIYDVFIISAGKETKHILKGHIKIAPRVLKGK